MWPLPLPAHLPVVVALQKQEVGEVKGRVDGVLGGVVVAALRLLLLRAQLQRLFVGLGFGTLPQGALLGPTGLLPHAHQIHLAQTPPDAQSLHLVAAAIHKQRGHPGAALLQLSGLSVDAWTDRRTPRSLARPHVSRPVRSQLSADHPNTPTEEKRSRIWSNLPVVLCRS